MDCIITIDMGTGSVKIFAFEMNGNVIGSMKGSYPTFHNEPDYSEQDPERYYYCALCIEKFPDGKNTSQKYKVVAICFSGAMHVCCLQISMGSAGKRYNVVG
jgi:gluconokinase